MSLVVVVAQAALQVLAVRVLVEAALGHEERGDGARRQAHGGGARRDAAAPALAARVVQHVQRRARRPNALCAHTRTLQLSLSPSSGDRLVPRCCHLLSRLADRDDFLKVDRSKRVYYHSFE